MMRQVFSAAAVLLVCLLAAGPASAQPGNPNGDIVRLVFDYGFFDENPATELPDQAAIEGVLCQTNYFISEMFQRVTGNPAYRITAMDITPSFNAEEPNPVRFEYTLNVTTADDSEIIPIDEQVAIFNTVNFNETTYIKEYVWNSEPNLPWFNVQNMTYTADKQQPVEGTITAAQCPETLAPTSAPTTIDELVIVNTTAPTATPGTETPAEVTDDALIPEANVTDAPGDGTDPDTTMAPDDPVATGGNVTTTPPDDPATGGNETDAPVGEPGDPTTAPRPEFTFDFGFSVPTDGDGATREPNEEEMFEVICNLNKFVVAKLSSVLGLNGTQHTAQNVDWTWTPGSPFPLQLNFTSNALDADGNPIPAEDIEVAMTLSTEDVASFIKSSVWTIGDETGPMFNVENIQYDAVVGIGQPRGPGRYPEVGCPETPAPTGLPTVSSMPTESFAPSSVPSVSPAPTLTRMPTATPSVTTPDGPVGTTASPTIAPTSSAPTMSAAPTTSTAPSSLPSSSPAPTSSTAPSAVPSVSLAPSESLAPTVGDGLSGGGSLGPGVPLPMSTSFVVSNTAGLTKPEQIRENGLPESWPVFIEEFVGDQNSRRRRMLRSGRRLAISVDPETAVITDVSQRTDCGPGVVKNLACFNATGIFELMVYGEDLEDANETYSEALDAAIDDGSYQEVLDRVAPDTPLYIGIRLANETSAPTPQGADTPATAPTGVGTSPAPAPAPEEKSGGMPTWLIILLIVLGILLLCCCLALLAMFLMAGKKDKNLDPYDEEKFVYEWLLPEGEKLQTEVDDATRDVDEDEEFEEPMESDEAEDEAAPVVTIMEDEFEDEDDEDEARAGDHETAETEGNEDAGWESDEEKPDPEEKERADEDWDDEGGVLVAGDEPEAAADDEEEEKWDDDEPGESFEEGETPATPEKKEDDSDGEDWDDED